MNITNALVVDDDIAVCRILHRMLSDEQYKVETSQSVADALGAVEQKPFDVYLMDYKLPDGSGLDVAERFDRNGVQLQSFLSRVMTLVPSRSERRSLTYLISLRNPSRGR